MKHIYGICGLLALLLVSACTMGEVMVVETRVPEATAVLQTTEPDLATAVLTPSPTITPTSSATPSATKVVPVDPTQTAQPDYAATVVATALPQTSERHLSPNKDWLAEVTIYDCVRTGAADYDQHAYELLRLQQVSDETEVIADDQLINCGGLGAFGLQGRFWSENGRYYYYTDAREGAPDGCGGFWQRPWLRVDSLHDWAVEQLGGGPISPDGTKIAAWHGRELIIWDIEDRELFRADAFVTDALPGSIHWAADNQSLVYTQYESFCPPQTSHIIQIDLETKNPQLLFESEGPTFYINYWNGQNTLHLSDETGGTWQFNVTTQEFTQIPETTTITNSDKVPDMVWFEDWFNFHENPISVLTVRDGVEAEGPFPMKITAFWDYSPLSGRVAFSNKPGDSTDFGPQVVSDLWVYNYEIEQAEMWFPNYVGRAAWSKNIDPRSGGSELLAVARYTENQQYVIDILTGAEQVFMTIPNASTHFSWSLDGQWLAFFREDEDPGLFIASPATGEVRKLASDLGGARSVNQFPLWVSEPLAVIDNSSSTNIRISFVDGSESVLIPTLWGDMLWDDKTHQLLISHDGGPDTPYGTIVLQLSDDLQTVVADYELPVGEFNRAADWLIPGERLILDDLQIIDWPITNP